MDVAAGCLFGLVVGLVIWAFVIVVILYV